MPLTARRLVPLVVLGLLAAVPGAAEAAPKASLSVSTVSAPPSSLGIGGAFTVRGTVANGKGRASSTGRISITLRTSRTSAAARLLGRVTVRKLAGGAKTTYRIRVSVPRDTPAGSYVVVVCVRRGKATTGKATCKATSKKLKVTVPAAAPVPTPLPTPAPAPAPAAPAPVDSRPAGVKLSEAITKGALSQRAADLQAIGDANNGTRAAATPGYQASVDYVVRTLKAAGYVPTVESFPFTAFTEDAPAELEVTAPTPKTYPAGEEVGTFTFSATGEATGTVEPVDVVLGADRSTVTSGCEAADFTGFTGDIALIQRGTCTFEEKIANATTAGAKAVIIFNQGNTEERSGPLAGTANTPTTIPAIGVPFATGVELATPGTVARVKTTTTTTNTTTKNVIAETDGGNPDKTVIVGSHLDSVPAGPGINDNGSGSAFNLELAVQMARLGIQPANRVRFAWWGAEELGLLGSTYYAEHLPAAELKQIAANLNFDMLASPNHINLVYDGDGSSGLNPADLEIPAGSDKIEQAFLDQLAAQKQPTAPTAFDGRSDYGPFIAAGIPAGGLFSGAEEIKSEAEARVFGGVANTAFDPNYHGAGDTLGNLDLTGFETLADAAAAVTGQLASDTGLVARSLGSSASSAVSKARMTRALKAATYRGERAQR